jgi:hypothetical protein
LVALEDKQLLQPVDSELHHRLVLVVLLLHREGLEGNPTITQVSVGNQRQQVVPLERLPHLQREACSVVHLYKEELLELQHLHKEELLVRQQNE